MDHAQRSIGLAGAADANREIADLTDRIQETVLEIADIGGAGRGQRAGDLVADDRRILGVDEAGRQAAFDPNLADACAAIQQTRARVLVIHGEEDWMVPTYHGKRLHEAAPDHSQLVLLPWTGHLTAWLDPLGQVADETHRWFDTHLAQNEFAMDSRD